MRNACAVGLVVVFAIAMPDQLRSQTAVPLSIVSVQIDRAKNIVEFVLRNDSVKPVTAWQVAITYPDDSVTGNTGEGMDGYWNHHLAPGAVVTHSFRVHPRASSTPISVDIQPTAAVYADRSTIGDPKFAEHIFAERAREGRAWQEILAALEMARDDTTTGTEPLQLARDYLAASTEDPDHPRKRIMRADLDRAIQGARLGRVNASALLTEFIEEARKRVTAATAHTRAQ
jgi:hypothetical protein